MLFNKRRGFKFYNFYNMVTNGIEYICCQIMIFFNNFTQIIFTISSLSCKIIVCNKYSGMKWYIMIERKVLEISIIYHFKCNIYYAFELKI